MTAPDLPPPVGEEIRVAWEKWGGRPHWRSEADVGPRRVRYLGEDEHGWWYGQPEGVVYRRPGVEFTTHGTQVGCFPRDRCHTAAFYEPHPLLRFRVYVDVTTAPAWRLGADGLPELTAIDLDLDVIGRFDGGVFVDDEDEFAEHTALFGYPAEVVEAAVEEAARLVREVGRPEPRLGEPLASHWRGVLRGLDG